MLAGSLGGPARWTICGRGGEEGRPDRDVRRQVRQGGWLPEHCGGHGGLHALAKEVKTYEEHHILAGYMEATIMRSLGGGARSEGLSVAKKRAAD